MLAFSIGVLSPVLPPYVGAPEVDRHLRLQWPAKPVVRIENNEGAVTVMASERKDIAAEVRILGYERRSGALKDSDAYLATLMRVQEAGEALRVTAEPEERPEGVELLVDLHVAVPSGTNIEIFSSSGNVWVTEGCGSVTVHGRNTDIEIDGPRGDVVANSTNGRIRLVGAANDANVETVNGNVYAHMKGGSLQASTMNGAIVARVLGPEVRYCQLNAQNGGITLVLNSECAAFVEAKTGRGIIRSDFPVDTTHGVHHSRHLEGHIGPGRMYLSMETLNGNVWIARSKP